ncbi:UNKNOWN [Stylonychia lemnae]|uniref:Uncharacterized protein n=1 Tax=Stylonychia lemnae TaxID=5949 RepID=A0A078AYX2_STYLE|nr:UNKNOWN [Stylonychia lemnae]|eukprot:CDW85993.1 UNKNOWN [Stylonychia lemnae]
MRITSLIFTVLASSAAVNASSCWQDAYGRGVGEVITTCSNGLQKDGALCYPYCNSGFYGVGPVCWESCKDGYTDTGVDCLKPSSYGRGAGYALWSWNQCLNDNPQGCEQWGALYYPKCRPNFHNAACCICSPDCPSGQVDIGVSCQKNTYGRGVGVPLGCASGLEMSGALCYPPCSNDYHGNGPVCWQNCPAGKYSCGALCTDSADQCSSSVKNIVQDIFEAAVLIAVGATTGEADIPGILQNLGGAATELANAVCDHSPRLEFIQ